MIKTEVTDLLLDTDHILQSPVIDMTIKLYRVFKSNDNIKMQFC